MDFAGRRALITGGSSGIGLALAQQLAEQGAHVWILARHPDRLAQAVETVRESRISSDQAMDALAVDVADLDAVQRALSQFTAQELLPDLLINSAGVAHPGYAEELGADIFHWMIDVNYFGTVHVTQTLLPAMIRRGSGHIVNISSIAGFLGLFGYTAYCGSKFAVRGYTDALRAEMKRKGLNVSVVFPPDTLTPQLEYENKFKPPETATLDGLANVAAPEAVARAILKGIAKRRYVIAPGFDSKFWFWVSSLLGTAAYPIMDLMLGWAAGQVRKASQSKSPSSESRGE